MLLIFQDSFDLPASLQKLPKLPEMLLHHLLLIFQDSFDLPVSLQKLPKLPEMPTLRELPDVREFILSKLPIRPFGHLMRKMEKGFGS